MATISTTQPATVLRVYDMLASRPEVTDRESAERLLDVWEFTPALTGREREDILVLFPGARCEHCGAPVERVDPAGTGLRYWRHTGVGVPAHGWVAVVPRKPGGTFRRSQ
jgi:hypothetical protein